jgi:phospholipid transport system substrate-binding protein
MRISAHQVAAHYPVSGRESKPRRHSDLEARHLKLRPMGIQKSLRISNRMARSLALLMLAAVLGFSIGSAREATAADMGPMASVKSVIDQAIVVFKDHSLTPADRDKKLRTLAESHIDFERMARTAVGRHWRDFSPEQQTEFVPLFTTFIEDVYLTRIQEYTVGKVEETIQTSRIQFIKERMDAPDLAVVFSQVTLENRAKPAEVNFLVKLDGADWRIYDITLDAISVMANYRNQFNRVLNDGGYDKLVSILRQKQQALGASMTTPNP